MDFQLGEARLSGARYWTARPKIPATDLTGWLDLKCARQAWETWDDMEAWCKQNFGFTPIDGIWTTGSRWYMNDSKFLFRNHDDLVLFLLRYT